MGAAAPVARESGFAGRTAAPCGSGGTPPTT